MIFRRSRRPDPRQLDESPERGEQPSSSASPLPAGAGPYDADEIGYGSDGAGSVNGAADLGGLVVRPGPGVQLRLRVDEKSQAVLAAILTQGEAGLELRAFAAPRNSGLWDEIRQEVATEATRRGGVITEATGRFGAEVTVQVPTRTAEGKTVSQTSRIVGVDGPRWFLRATFFGGAALDAEVAQPLEDALADVIVVRGKDPMAPRDLISLNLPSGTEVSSRLPTTEEQTNGKGGPK